MSWQDDLSARVEAATKNIGNDIQSYIKARVVDPVVKIGEPAKGNLSAAELAAGARGENPDATIASDAMPASGDMMKYAIPIVAVVVLGYFLLKSKRRG